MLEVVRVAAEDDDTFVPQFDELCSMLLEDGLLLLAEMGDVHTGSEFKFDEEMTGRLLRMDNGGGGENDETEESHFATALAAQ